MSRSNDLRESGQLIDRFELQTSRSVHSGEHLVIEVTALLEADLTPVMPYLNAELPGARYTPSIPALVWMHADHQIGILPDRIAVDHFHEDEDPTALLDQIVNIINEV
jgi:ArsR family metal-binding transcriptional regulator